MSAPARRKHRKAARAQAADQYFAPALASREVKRGELRDVVSGVLATQDERLNELTDVMNDELDAVRKEAQSGLSGLAAEVLNLLHDVHQERERLWWRWLGRKLGLR